MFRHGEDKVQLHVANILAKSSNRPLTLSSIFVKTKINLSSIYIPKLADVSVNLKIKRFDKTLNITSRMRRWTQVPQFSKFTKVSSLSQFVKNHFLKYPIFMSKTTSLLKHRSEETHLYWDEHYSSMTVVAMGQNVKTYLSTQCKFLLILKMGVPVFIGASCV